MPQMSDLNPDVPDMTPEEAVRAYQDWRRRAIDTHDNRATTEEDLCAQLRDC